MPFQDRSSSTGKNIDYTSISPYCQWGSFNQAVSSDNLYATMCFVESDTYESQLGTWYNFGFDIPAWSTVDGVIVYIERKHTDADAVKDKMVTIWKDSLSTSGNNKSTGTTWPTTDTTKDYGSPTDKWGLTLTPSDVNSSGFGMGIATEAIEPTGAIWGGGANCLTHSIDYIYMRVYYSFSVTDVEIGSNQVNRIRYGDKEVKKVYYGNNLIQG